MLSEFLKHGSKIMKKLSCCIALALIGHSAHSGELTISPSVEYSLYKAKVESPQPELVRDTAINVLTLDAEIEYSAKHLSSLLSGKLSKYEYSDGNEGRVESDDLRWSTSANLWREDLTVFYDWQRYAELYNSIQGSFADEIFARENYYINYHQGYGLNYRLPTSSLLSGRLSLKHEVRKSKPKENETLEPARENTGYKTDKADFQLGQYRGSRPLFWVLSGNALHQDSRGTDFYSYNAQFRTRAKLYDKWHASARVDYSYYENSMAWRYADGGQGITSQVYSGGFAWVKDHEHSFIELFYNKDHDSDELYFGGEIRWRLADKWFLSAEKRRRFYGSSDQFSFSYTGINHRVSASYNDSLEYRHMLIAENYVEGVYVCRFDENQEEYSLDKELCFLPEDELYVLQPGESLLTNMETSYPLATRLTHSESASFNWDYLGATWQHTFWLKAREQVELTDGYQQDQQEGFFSGDLELNSRSYIRSKWRYRHMELKPSGTRTTDRLYSLGYHFKLNSRATVSMSLQHLNKWTSGDTYNYDDNRIVLNYVHHFGSKNKKIETESRRSFK